MKPRQSSVRQDRTSFQWMALLGSLLLLGLVMGLVRPSNLGRANPTGACPTVPVTQKYTFLYGEVTIDAAPALPGSVVEARGPRGDTVGCRVVETAGEYPLMYVYGEETVAGTPVPGMRAGEVIAFAVNGLSATSDPVPTWVNDWTSYRVDLAAVRPTPCALFGDVDGDHEVAIADIGAVSDRWRLTAANPDPDNDPRTPNYEDRFDLDKDGIITVRDMLLVAAQLGQSCP